MDYMKKNLKTVLAGFFCAFGLWFLSSLCVKADEPLILVIDPGHGGDNLGAEYGDYTEKDMNMIVAFAMKEELETYDNVVVYLTHETDRNMSIEDRAHFAGEKNADFLFCLHFNSSVHHNLYGAEIWVSAFGDYYCKGRQFAEINLQLFEDMGLFSRGIKTRLNNRGDNYYGILRYCTKEGVPAALIEHCHLDQAKDQPFYQQSEEQLREFGRKDAEAAAKYFGLHSSLTGKDYSDFPKTEIPYRDIVKPDKTGPEECSIEVLEVDEKNGVAYVSLQASDSDNYIQYYSYSLDGGKTYSELLGFPRKAWNQSEPECHFTVSLPEDREVQLCAAAYNGFDLFSQSNIVTIPAISHPTPEAAASPEETKEGSPSKVYREIIYDIENAENPNQSREKKVQFLVLIFLLSLIMVGILYVLLYLFTKIKQYKRRR